MRVAVLGTGMVGRTIASKLVELGHEVRMGSRSATNAHLVGWVEGAGPRAGGGTFADAAAFGEVVFHAGAGAAALHVLAAAGRHNLDGKVLIDVANPLITHDLEVPMHGICNDDSLGEHIQRAYPDVRVVKTLNTVFCEVMVAPDRVPGEHVLFLSGNDDEAKKVALGLLGEFGWPAGRVIDLGDISTSRGPEMYLALYARMFLGIGHGDFNIAVNRAR
jgi:predicted dinucleotide-binding enzyme